MYQGDVFFFACHRKDAEPTMANKCLLVVELKFDMPAELVRLMSQVSDSLLHTLESCSASLAT